MHSALDITQIQLIKFAFMWSSHLHYMIFFFFSLGIHCLSFSISKSLSKMRFVSGGGSTNFMMTHTKRRRKHYLETVDLNQLLRKIFFIGEKLQQIFHGNHINIIIGLNASSMKLERKEVVRA